MSSVTTELVRRFNNLPRPGLHPHGGRNHYHFAVKPLPSTLGGQIVPGDAVFIVNPYNIQYCCEGRTEILRLTPDQQSSIIVPLLLEAFVNTFSDPMQALFQMVITTNPIAPFTWSTTNERLAQAVSRQCQALGIRRELCNVSVSSIGESQIAERCWDDFSGHFVESLFWLFRPDDGAENVQRKCNVCGFTPSLDRSLHRCVRCTRVWYCSQACQVADYEAHTRDCPDLD